MKICMVGTGAFAKKHLDALARIKGVEVVSLHGTDTRDHKRSCGKIRHPALDNQF